MKIEDTVALVTGGAHGIGRALCRSLHTGTSHFQRKADDHGRWVGGMRRYRRKIIAEHDKSD